MTSNKLYGLSTEKIQLNSIKRVKKQDAKEHLRDSEPVYVNTTLPRGQLTETVDVDDPDYETLQRLSALIQKSQQVSEGKATPEKDKHVTLLMYTMLGLVVVLFLAVSGLVIALGVTASQAKASMEAWSAWEPWTQCSMSCGFGKAHRKRTCTKDQYCVGDSTENKICHEVACPVTHGDWSAWSEWGFCSSSCMKSRYRTCTDPPPSTNGQICMGNSDEKENCNLTACGLTPVHGGWSVWSDWGECSATCNTGMQERRRTCSNPRPRNGGEHCDGVSTNYRLCNNTTCEGAWGAWQSWSQCSVSCGFGMIRRNRTCMGVVHCVGDSTDYQPCNEEPCEGNWSVWESWSQCSSSCGFGMTRRNRTCMETHLCVGDQTEYQLCNEESCLASDCYDIQQMGVGLSDGIYNVRLWRSRRTVSVYCYLTTNGGGWTVFQKRFNGSVDFYRNFANYTRGFGDLSFLGEFWLGLETVHEMTTKRPTELRIDLTSASGTHGYDVFRNFYISTGPGYNLHNDGGTGTLGERYYGLSYSTNSAFSTFDHDNDTNSGNCANSNTGGWWYKSCTYTNLNGLYYTPGSYSLQSMFYYSFSHFYSLKDSVMMFRPQF